MFFLPPSHEAYCMIDVDGEAGRYQFTREKGFGGKIFDFSSIKTRIFKLKNSKPRLLCQKLGAFFVF